MDAPVILRLAGWLLQFFPFITPEMIDYAQREREAKIAAMTPDERAWLAAEATWKHALARQEEEARHAMYEDMATLLEADVRIYGES